MAKEIGAVRRSISLIQHVHLSSLLLAWFAFFASWVMTGQFDDDFARLTCSTAFAGWVAVGSGITGYILRQCEDCR
jgi:hypothetical protein